MTTFSYTTGNPSNLVGGGTASMNDIQGPFTDLRVWVNGSIDGDNLTSTAGQQLGLGSSTITRRGKTNISATETRNNTAYGTLTTPDQVSGIVLPTDGLIAVLYQARWQESVIGASRAAIFIGSNQLQIQQSAAGRGAGTQAASSSGSGIANTDTPLFTAAGGLYSLTPGGAYSADVTTGQVAGYVTNAGTGVDNLAAEIGGGIITMTGGRVASGPCYIYAAAGTYTISVQFKATSGTVTAKDRHLWVWTLGF
jgi:hypothetical protein